LGGGGLLVQFGGVDFGFGLIDEAVTVGVHFGELFLQATFGEGDFFRLGVGDFSVAVEVTLGEDFGVESGFDLTSFFERHVAIAIEVEAIEEPGEADFVDFGQGQFAVFVGIGLQEQVAVGFRGGAGGQQSRGERGEVEGV